MVEQQDLGMEAGAAQPLLLVDHSFHIFVLKLTIIVFRPHSCFTTLDKYIACCFVIETQVVIELWVRQKKFPLMMIQGSQSQQYISTIPWFNSSVSDSLQLNQNSTISSD